MENILMCYEDAIVIDLVRISLEDKNFNVIGSLNSNNLLSKIQQVQPIAIILDQDMVSFPSEEVKAVLHGNIIPVVVFSSELNGRKNAIEAGANHFVGKTPFGFEELENVIDQVLVSKSPAIH